MFVGGDLWLHPFLQQKKAKVTKQAKEKEDSGKRQGKAKAKTKK